MSLTLMPARLPSLILCQSMHFKSLTNHSYTHDFQFLQRKTIHNWARADFAVGRIRHATTGPQMNNLVAKTGFFWQLWRAREVNVLKPKRLQKSFPLRPIGTNYSTSKSGTHRSGPKRLVPRADSSAAPAAHDHLSSTRLRKHTNDRKARRQELSDFNKNTEEPCCTLHKGLRLGATTRCGPGRGRQGHYHGISGEIPPRDCSWPLGATHEGDDSGAPKQQESRQGRSTNPT